MRLFLFAPPSSKSKENLELKFRIRKENITWKEHRKCDKTPDFLVCFEKLCFPPHFVKYETESKLNLKIDRVFTEKIHHNKKQLKNKQNETIILEVLILK